MIGKWFLNYSHYHHKHYGKCFFFPKIMATFIVIFEFCWAFFRGQDPGIGDFHGRCCHGSVDPGEGWDGRSPFQWVGWWTKYPRSSTVRPWNMMVGRWAFPFGTQVTFQGRAVKLEVGCYIYYTIYFLKVFILGPNLTPSMWNLLFAKTLSWASKLGSCSCSSSSDKSR